MKNTRSACKSIFSAYATLNSNDDWYAKLKAAKSSNKQNQKFKIDTTKIIEPKKSKSNQNHAQKKEFPEKQEKTRQKKK